jgi:hypothetical protein
MKRQTPLPAVAVIALLASALVPALLLGALTPLTGDLRNKNPVTMLAMAVVFYPFAAALAVLLGLPTFFLLRWLGILRWWSTLLAGCVIGTVAVSIATHQILLGRGLLLHAGIGGASALVFWAIWTRAASGRRGSVPNDA